MLLYSTSKKQTFKLCAYIFGEQGNIDLFGNQGKINLFLLPLFLESHLIKPPSRAHSTRNPRK